MKNFSEKEYIGMINALGKISMSTNETSNNKLEEKDKEIERLKEVEKEHQKLNGELREENKRLNNIIDELEHKLYQEWLEWKDSDCESIYVRAFEDKAIYDYIQELKGVDKE